MVVLFVLCLGSEFLSCACTCFVCFTWKRGSKKEGMTFFCDVIGYFLTSVISETEI